MCAPLPSALAAQQPPRTGASATMTASVTILPAVDAAPSMGSLFAALEDERTSAASTARMGRMAVTTPRRFEGAVHGALATYADPPLARSFTRVSASRVRYEVAVLY